MSEEHFVLKLSRVQWDKRRFRPFGQGESVKKVLKGSIPGEIEAAVAKVMGVDQSLYRKLCIHLSHQWSGWSLE